MEFKRAVKQEAKGRIALIGPAGSGKSFTSLKLAGALAGGGKIAAIDTEHGSLSKYAHTDDCGGAGVCQAPDHFDFDVIELSSFTIDNFLSALKTAEKGAYSVFLCDSLSHFWVGKDGALEFVDMATKRHRDQMGGWKDFRPHERAMVDAMLMSPCHVIATMRTKTEYQEVTGADGKKKRVKIGLAPVQREGLEYEFDLVGYMDDENTFIVDKTRCFYYSQKALTKPGEKEFAPFIEWLKGAPVKSAPAPEAYPDGTRMIPGPSPEQLKGDAPAPSIISDAQRTRLYAIANKHKVSAETIKAYLVNIHGIESSKAIPREKYEEICQWLEAAKNGSSMTAAAV
jgi:hypothetical protein